ncbi:MAG: hypothetical protein AAF752_13315 [Bacteroidota bacterium]
MSDDSARPGRRVDALVRHLPPGVAGPLRHVWGGIRRTFTRPHPAPVFMLGMQKSGTTAIAALAAQRSGLEATLDLLPEIKQPMLPKVYRGEISLQRFIRTNSIGFSRPLVKEASLSPLRDRLGERFPDARFVWILRRPEDTIRSILNRLSLPGHQAELTPEQWSAVPAVWKTVLDSSWLGLPGGDYVERLAHRWQFTAERYASHAGTDVLVTYEAFLSDKPACIDHLLNTLALPARHDISARLDHRFQPGGDRHVDLDAFFGPDRLRRIHAICRSGIASIYQP